MRKKHSKPILNRAQYSTFWALINNKSAIDIAHNPVQHDRTKHVEIDRHFIKEKLESGIIIFLFVKSEDHLADVLNKAVASKVFIDSFVKLSMGDIHAPT